MNESMLIQTILFIAFVLSFISNLYNSKRINTLEKQLFEVYKDNPEVKHYIQHDLKQASPIEAIKQLRGKYGFSLEHAKRMVDRYK
jgi:ribosomal protein L7/L12